MKGLGRVLGLTMLLVCFLWAKTYPATSKVQTYVSRDGSKNLALDGSSSFLFAQQMEDTIKVEKADSIILKDPKKAIFYAFIPGIVVHGSGHFYAGAKTTGWILVAGEIISLPLLTYAIGVGIGESTNGSTSNGDAEIVGIFAGTLFIGTWIYDLIGAPLAAQRQNQKLLGKKNMGLNFEFDRGSDFVRFQIVKRF